MTVKQDAWRALVKKVWNQNRMKKNYTFKKALKDAAKMKKKSRRFQV
jgi:hypothetical protein